MDAWKATVAVTSLVILLTAGYSVREEVSACCCRAGEEPCAEGSYCVRKGHCNHSRQGVPATTASGHEAHAAPDAGAVMAHACPCAVRSGTPHPTGATQPRIREGFFTAAVAAPPPALGETVLPASLTLPTSFVEPPEPPPPRPNA